MKENFTFIAILLLFCCCFANYEGYVYTDESFEQLIVGKYTFFEKDGKIGFIFENSTILNDEKKIEKALKDYSIIINNEYEKSELKANVMEFNKSRDERECYSYTGLNLRNCTNREECKFACLSSPICYDALYSYEFSFLDSISSFFNDTMEMNGIIERINSNNRNGSQLMNDLGRLEFLANKIKQNKLFQAPPDGYYFCPMAKYNLDYIVKAKKHGGRIYYKETINSNPSREAKIVANSTIKRMALKESRDECANAENSLVLPNISGVGQFSEIRILYDEVEALKRYHRDSCLKDLFEIAQANYSLFHGKKSLLNSKIANYSNKYSLLLSRFRNLNASNSTNSEIKLKMGMIGNEIFNITTYDDILALEKGLNDVEELAKKEQDKKESGVNLLFLAGILIPIVVLYYILKVRKEGLYGV